jgi:hypothetical protein
MPAPQKSCPQCSTKVHVRVRVCSCGFHFPIKGKEPPKVQALRRAVARIDSPAGPSLTTPVENSETTSEDNRPELIAPTGFCPVDLPVPDLLPWVRDLQAATPQLRVGMSAIRFYARQELDRALYRLRGLV